MRKKEKLKKTYCEGFMDAVDINNVIHCDYRQMGARTGRFSCTNPNLQNIPRPDEKKSNEAKLIRSLFLVRPGYTNYYLDYSQIEYRLAAEYSQDEDLIQRINAGEDVHTIQAQRIFKKSKEEVTKYERSIAKTVNFAILYGSSVKALAATLNMSLEEAQTIYDTFLQSNPNLSSLQCKIKNTIYRRGYVFNKFGRRRHLTSKDSYKTFNSLCQGLAADIIKHAMVRIHTILKDTQSNLLMNVHDEVCIEIFNGEEYLLPKIQDAMENFGDMFHVKILVETTKTKTNWFEKK